MGRKAGDYYRRRRPGQMTESSVTGPSITYDQAAELARRLAARFVEGELDDLVEVDRHRLGGRDLSTRRRRHRLSGLHARSH